VGASAGHRRRMDEPGLAVPSRPARPHPRNQCGRSPASARLDRLDRSRAPGRAVLPRGGTAPRPADPGGHDRRPRGRAHLRGDVRGAGGQRACVPAADHDPRRLRRAPEADRDRGGGCRAPDRARRVRAAARSAHHTADRHARSRCHRGQRAADIVVGRPAGSRPRSSTSTGFTPAPAGETTSRSAAPSRSTRRCCAGRICS